MNDNVSYTVIATGFGQNDKTESKVFKEQKENDIEKKNKFAGYDVETFEIPTEPQELDTPTIFRQKGSNKILSEASAVPNGGFKLDQLDAFAGEEAEEKKEQKKDKGGSSFLRMMMD